MGLIVISNIMNALLLLMPIIVISVVFRTAWFKGIAGEFIVNFQANLLLDKNEYQIIKNVTLPTEDGTTQIDHIIVSKYGVFVVETKNMKGWIFGLVNQKNWTQKIYKNSNQFQNPLHQNYKHVKTLQNLLGLNDDQVYSVVVFIGDCQFKTDMPDNVTKGSTYIKFIKSKSNIVLTASEVDKILVKIKSNKLSQSLKTSTEHIKHVKNIVAQKENSKTCPKCGGKMVLRQVKKGPNAGKSFFGCSQFPACNGVVNVT
jgi:restriction system protein